MPLRTALLVIALCSFAQSQQPPPSPAKPTQAQKVQVASKEQKGQPKQKDSPPSSLPAAGDPVTSSNGQKGTNQAEDKTPDDWRPLALTFVIALAAVIQVIVYIYQASYMRKGLRISRRQTLATKLSANAALVSAMTALEGARSTHTSFVVSQRPKIVVRRISPKDKVILNAQGQGPSTFGVSLTQHDPIQGKFMVHNIGGTKATITRVFSEVRILQYLPGIPPYESTDSRIETCALTLAAGMSDYVKFPTVVSGFDTKEWTLLSNGQPIYVMGWVEYTDEIGNARTTAFCRKWSKSFQRFEKVKDDDYEYAD